MAERPHGTPDPGWAVDAIRDQLSPGDPVLVVGRDTGWLADSLVRNGFTLTEAGPANAAVCVDWDGGSEAARRRCLASIRRRLVPRGMLVVDGAPPAEVLRASGFAVRSGTEGARVVARSLPAPPQSLAAAAWGEPADGVQLDLRYADDEAEWLDPVPAEVWAGTVAAAGDAGAGVVAHYPVDDPYGATRGAPAIARHFACPLAPDQVTFAAGITALLHDLSGLADGGPVLAPALVHPDLESWALASGAEVRLLDEPVSCAALVEAISRLRPALVHLDRPSFTAQVLSLSELVLVGRAAAEVGAVVVVDEAAAPYLRPAGSAVPLLHKLDNLVVLRGFTKAYSMGGLRCGYAVASAGVATQVRELVAPMQVGELAFAGALRLLAAGDCFDRLRARIREVKPAFAARLTGLGYRVTGGHEDIPWLVVADPGGSAARRLAACGIRGLAPVPPPVPAPQPSAPLHLTVPISARRIELFESLVRPAQRGRG